MRPQQSDQAVQSNQKRGQEQHGPVGVAEEEQEAQGDDITWWAQVGQPGLKDAKETQKTCGNRKQSVTNSESNL